MKGLVEQDEIAGVAELLEQGSPRVVGVAGADDDLQPRIDCPELADGLDAVPARRHAHVDERDRIGALVGESLADEAQPLLPLIGGVDDKGLVRRRARCGRRLEDLPIVVVNRQHVVDDQQTQR
jgi:hypothetical protein